MGAAARVGGLALCAAMLCALQAPAPTFDPRHYVNNDPIWDELNRVDVRADRQRGVYLATFPDALRRRASQPLRLSGFILPLEVSATSAHFSLVRRNTACPFCPPNAPTEAVEVFAEAPVRYTGEEVTMSGRLELVSSSDEGLFYRLRGARPAPRTAPSR